jgi:hypothetical protein
MTMAEYTRFSGEIEQTDDGSEGTLFIDTGLPEDADYCVTDNSDGTLEISWDQSEEEEGLPINVLGVEITDEDIQSTLKVLETMQEEFYREGMESRVVLSTEAHCTVQQFRELLTSSDETGGER